MYRNICIFKFKETIRLLKQYKNIKMYFSRCILILSSNKRLSYLEIYPVGNWILVVIVICIICIVTILRIQDTFFCIVLTNFVNMGETKDGKGNLS